MSVHEKMTAIADAIRAKTGDTEALTLDGMAAAISTIKSDPVLTELTVTANGEYTPDAGVDGFSKVTVSVEAEGSAGWETTEYIHSEDWPDNTLGLASNFVELYCNDYNEEDVTVFLCEVTGNPQTYRYAVGMECIRHKSYDTSSMGTSFRWGGGAVTEERSVGSDTALFMVAGAVVTVRKFVLALEEAE